MEAKTEKQRLLEQINYFKDLIKRKEAERGKLQQLPSSTSICPNTKTTILQRKDQPIVIQNVCNLKTNVQNCVSGNDNTTQCNNQRSNTSVESKTGRTAKPSLVKVTTTTVTDFKNAPQSRASLFDGQGTSTAQQQRQPVTIISSSNTSSSTQIQTVQKTFGETKSTPSVQNPSQNVSVKNAPQSRTFQFDGQGTSKAQQQRQPVTLISSSSASSSTQKQTAEKKLGETKSTSSVQHPSQNVPVKPSQGTSKAKQQRQPVTLISSSSTSTQIQTAQKKLSEMKSMSSVQHPSQNVSVKPSQGTSKAQQQRQPVTPISSSSTSTQIQTVQKKLRETKSTSSVKHPSQNVPVNPSSLSVPVKPTSTSVPVQPTSISVSVKPTSVGVPMKPTSTNVPGKPSSNSVSVKPTSVGVPVKPTSTNVPGKPSSNSVPAKPTSHNVPVKATSISVPVKPSSTNVPVKPTINISAKPSSTVSVPAKPTSLSVPDKPTSISVPVKATSHNVPVKPTSTSDPAKPTSHNVPVKPTSIIPAKPTSISVPVESASKSVLPAHRLSSASSKPSLPNQSAVMKKTVSAPVSTSSQSAGEAVLPPPRLSSASGKPSLPNPSAVVRNTVSAPAPASTSSQSHNEQLMAKRAEAAAARERMKSKLDDLKATLQQLEAVKKKKKIDQASSVNTSEESSKDGLSKMQGSAKSVQNLLSLSAVGGSSKIESEMKDSQSHKVIQPCKQNIRREGCEVKVLTSGKPNVNMVKTVSTDKPKNVSTSKHQSVISTSSGNVPLSNTAAVQHISASNSLQSSQAQTLARSASTSSAMQPTGKPSSNLSQSSAMAELEKELKETQAKLSSMRQKVDMLMKESSSKSSQDSSRTSAVSGSSNIGGVKVNKLDHALPVQSNVRTLQQNAAVTVPSTSRQFPDHQSLSWTSATSPIPTTSRQPSVVGISPSVRQLLRLPTKAAFGSAKNRRQWLTYRSAANPNKAQYRFVRNVDASSRNPKGSYHAHSTARPFVGGYFFTQNAPKAHANNRNANIGSRVIFKPQYKFTKGAATHLSWNQQQSSTKQRAAQVIKSKYKLRKVPVKTASRRLSFSSTDVAKLSKNQSNTWISASTKYRLQTKYNMSVFAENSVLSSVHSPGASSQFGRNFRGKGRGIGSSRYQSSWTQRKIRLQQQYYFNDSSFWSQKAAYRYGSNGVYDQRSLFYTAKAAMKHQQQVSYSSPVKFSTSTSWPRKSDSSVRLFQYQQKKLLIKRLQWVKKYSLSRKTVSPVSSSRESSPTKSTSMLKRPEHLVMINGILYRSSSNHLTKASSSASTIQTSPSKQTASASAFTHPSTAGSSVVVRNMKRCQMSTVTVRGVHFKMDARGTKLQRVQSTTKHDKMAAISRVDVGGTTFVLTKDGVLEKISDFQTRNAVNRVKQRSIATAAAKYKKKNTKTSKKNCLFFTRFGKCGRRDKCPYLHDPEKVAVCTRFLRGTCKVADCPFSHKVSKEKMPVCAFFLRGVCTRDDCPYLHVKVNQGAEICRDFVAGFCPLAEKCPKVHTLTCPHFAKTGQCPDGKKCRLLHRTRKPAVRKGRVKSTSSSTSQDRLSSELKRSAPSDNSKGADLSLEPPEKRIRLDLNPEGQDERQTVVTASYLSESVLLLSHSEDVSSIDVSSIESRRGRTTSLQRPVEKLPAFISLARYSPEESPILTLSRAEQKKSSPMKTESSSLHIKPRLGPL